MSDADETLLRRFVEDASESAFAELVSRHLDWVHSSALRQVADHSLAEEATQSAFLILARQSREVLAKLAAGAPLSAWLHVTVRNVAVKITRGEVRRRAREREAGLMSHALNDEQRLEWEEWSPYLDEALSELAEADRHALLMRFFEQRTAREIGVLFGVSEEAAQKRTSRAVERLRTVFERRGIAVSDSGLVAVLAACAVGTAPSGLAASIATAVAASLPAASQLAGLAGLAKQIVFMSKTQTGLVGAVVVLSFIPLQQQRVEITRLKAELATSAPRPLVNSSKSVQGADSGDRFQQAEIEEIARLRAEVEQLRNAVSTVMVPGVVPDTRVKLELGRSVAFAELEFAGDASPEAALQSSLALERAGDLAGTLRVTLFSPKSSEEFQELLRSPEMFSQVSERMKTEAAKVERVSMTRNRAYGANRVMIELAMIQTTETNLHSYNLVRVADGWRVLP